MLKFDRKFKMIIETNDSSTIEITSPFTLEFNITRNVLSSANTASFRIYNLNETNRALLLKNRVSYDDKKRIYLSAGYGLNLSDIFAGDIMRCYSSKEGSNMVTNIEAFDAGYAFVNAILEEGATYPKGTLKKDIVADLMSKLSSFGVETGKIGSIEGETSRGSCLSGGIVQALTNISNGSFFIDGGKAHYMGESEALEGTLVEIDADSGLMGSPTRENEYIEFSMIFEPRMIVGQELKIKSVTNKVFNDKVYKVVSVKHQGNISETMGGSAVTIVGCYVGSALTIL